MTTAEDKASTSICSQTEVDALKKTIADQQFLDECVRKTMAIVNDTEPAYRSISHFFVPDDVTQNGTTWQVKGEDVGFAIGSFPLSMFKKLKTKIEFFNSKKRRLDVYAYDMFAETFHVTLYVTLPAKTTDA